MSFYHGRQGAGAAKRRKAVLTDEATERGTGTPEHHRKAFRVGPVPEGGRTERSIRTYRTAFLSEHGNTPENVRAERDAS